MHQKDPFRIEAVRTAGDLAAVVALLRAYAAGLDVDLAYQGFAAELAAMPGEYAPPAGELLLARRHDGVPAGCVALRPLAEEGCCEMKRLYVAADGRGLGLGGALVQAILGHAVRLGYREMRLDTLPSMTVAAALYRKAGFEPAEPYYSSPVSGTMFMRRLLVPGAASAGR